MVLTNDITDAVKQEIWKVVNLSDFFFIYKQCSTGLVWCWASYQKLVSSNMLSSWSLQKRISDVFKVTDEGEAGVIAKVLCCFCWCCLKINGTLVESLVSVDMTHLSWLSRRGGIMHWMDHFDNLQFSALAAPTAWNLHKDHFSCTEILKKYD